MSLSAYGFEVNPAAWSFSKLYEFANLPPAERERPLSELRRRIEKEFPIILFSNEELPPEEVQDRISRIGQLIGDKAKILCNAAWRFPMNSSLWLRLSNSPVLSDLQHLKKNSRA